MLVAIDKFGRMVLPKAIRDDFSLVPGDKIEVVEQDDCILLRPLHENAMLKEKHGVLVFSGAASGDMTKAVEDARADRLDSLARWREKR